MKDLDSATGNDERRLKGIVTVIVSFAQLYYEQRGS